MKFDSIEVQQIVLFSQWSIVGSSCRLQAGKTLSTSCRHNSMRKCRHYTYLHSFRSSLSLLRKKQVAPEVVQQNTSLMPPLLVLLKQVQLIVTCCRNTGLHVCHSFFQWGQVTYIVMNCFFRSLWRLTCSGTSRRFRPGCSSSFSARFSPQGEELATPTNCHLFFWFSPLQHRDGSGAEGPISTLTSVFGMLVSQPNVELEVARVCTVGLHISSCDVDVLIQRVPDLIESDLGNLTQKVVYMAALQQNHLYGRQCHSQESDT